VRSCKDAKDEPGTCPSTAHNATPGRTTTGSVPDEPDNALANEQAVDLPRHGVWEPYRLTLHVVLLSAAHSQVYRYTELLTTHHICAPIQHFRATGILSQPQREQHYLNTPSRPPTRAPPPRPTPPCRPRLLIAQLLPPRRDFAKGRLAKGPNARQRR